MKILLNFLFIAIFILSGIKTTFAMENNFNNKISSKIETLAEHTGYKYMIIDGVKYKRLWSYSKNCWIDPY